MKQYRVRVRKDGEWIYLNPGEGCSRVGLFKEDQQRFLDEEEARSWAKFMALDPNADRVELLVISEEGETTEIYK